MPTNAIYDDSDEDPANSTSFSRAKKARAEAVQTAREADLREKEKERERARAEAAGRRQERAGRRRTDDEPEDMSKPASARTSPPPSSQPASPPANPASEKVSHKKGAGKKTKKLGNNQYTKFKDLANQGSASSPHSKKRNIASGNGTSSGDEQLANGDSHPTNTSNSTNKNSPDHGNGVKGKFGKGKHKGVNGNGAGSVPAKPAELTLPQMKRQMELMSTFIKKAQMEAGGGDRTPSASEGLKVNEMAGGAVQPTSAGPVNGKGFDDMSAMEMGDVVQKNINDWQSRFDGLT